VIGDINPMEKVKFQLTGVIPVYQYANLQPTIETEADTFEEARDNALLQMKTIWDSVAEGGKTLALPEKQTAFAVQKCEISGAEVPFDTASHTYGPGWIGGSTFAGRYKTKFPKELIADKTAKKFDLPPQTVIDMWEKNGEASSSLGTAIHAALELYGKYLPTSMKIKGSNESVLHKNPLLTPIVEGFYTGREKENARYEVFVADAEKKFCGFIDRLLIVDPEKKIVRVQDYKTNPDIHKKETVLAPFKGVVEDSSLGVYWLQLSFYAYILIKHGYTVEGLDIFNYDGREWGTYQSDVIPIIAAI
jgi:hypothetical protein